MPKKRKAPKAKAEGQALTEKDLESWARCAFSPKDENVVVPKELRRYDEYGPHVPYGSEFVGIWAQLEDETRDWRIERGFSKRVRYAAVDVDGRVWELPDDGCGTWVPSMTDAQRREVTERVCALIDESVARMKEAQQIAEEAGLTFRMRADAQFHGIEISRGDEWYGGWESSYC